MPPKPRLPTQTSRIRMSESLHEVDTFPVTLLSLFSGRQTSLASGLLPKLTIGIFLDSPGKMKGISSSLQIDSPATVSSALNRTSSILVACETP